MASTNTNGQYVLNNNDFPPLNSNSGGVKIGSGSGYQHSKPPGDDLKNTATGLEQGNKGNRISDVNFFHNYRIPNDKYKLEFVEPSKRTLKFDYDQIDSVEKTYGICLLGFVLNGKPPTVALTSLVRRWGPNIRFQTHESGWITFIFPDAESRARILSGGNYMVAGYHLFIKEMPRCFRFREEDMKILPTWIQVHGLPPDCWNFEILSNVVSEIGKPLHVDMVTFDKKRSKYARVLVELDTSSPRVNEVSVYLPIGKVDVSVVFELDIKNCSRCSGAGHEDNSCKNTTEVFDENGALIGYKMKPRPKSNIGQRNRSRGRSTTRNPTRDASPVIQSPLDDTTNEYQPQIGHPTTTETQVQNVANVQNFGDNAMHTSTHEAQLEGDNDSIYSNAANDSSLPLVDDEVLDYDVMKNMDKGKGKMMDENSCVDHQFPAKETELQKQNATATKNNKKKKNKKKREETKTIH